MTVTPSQTAQFDHAMGLARQICARVFRDGGRPVDALEAFGIAEAGAATPDSWRAAVDRIAHELVCQRSSRSAEPVLFRAA